MYSHCHHHCHCHSILSHYTPIIIIFTIYICTHTFTITVTRYSLTTHLSRSYSLFTYVLTLSLSLLLSPVVILPLSPFHHRCSLKLFRRLVHHSIAQHQPLRGFGMGPHLNLDIRREFIYEDAFTQIPMDQG